MIVFSTCFANCALQKVRSFGGIWCNLGVYFLLCFCLVELPASKAHARDVIVFADFACTDDAAGDPDDCLAVEALRRTPYIRIVAVMTPGGNTHAQRAYELGQSKFPDLQLFPGTLPRSKRITKAHRELASVIFAHRSKLSFLVLSPATDFAKLAKVAPGIFTRIDEVVFVAGRSPNDRFVVREGGRALRDMNYEKDRRAFAVLIPMLHKSGINTSLVGFRTAMNTDVPKAFMPSDFVRKAQWAWARKCKMWFGAETPPFDVVAAMALTKHRQLLDCQAVRLHAAQDLKALDISLSNFHLCR